MYCGSREDLGKQTAVLASPFACLILEVTHGKNMFLQLWNENKTGDNTIIAYKHKL
jgi:hypothetical protein